MDTARGCEGLPGSPRPPRARRLQPPPCGGLTWSLWALQRGGAGDFSLIEPFEEMEIPEPTLRVSFPFGLKRYRKYCRYLPFI